MRKDRRAVYGIGVLVLFLGIQARCFAAAPPPSYNWKDKLERGVLNILTSPVEIARDIHTTTNEKNLLAGWTIGLVKGFGDGFMRLGAGFLDLFTFPFNFPDSHKAPLLDPEYVWEKPGVQYS